MRGRSPQTDTPYASAARAITSVRAASRGDSNAQPPTQIDQRPTCRAVRSVSHGRECQHDPEIRDAERAVIEGARRNRLPDNDKK